MIDAKLRTIAQLQEFLDATQDTTDILGRFKMQAMERAT